MMTVPGLRAGMIGVAAAMVWGWASAQQPVTPERPDVWPEHAVDDEEAGAAGRRPMPFTQEQIRQLAELVRQTQRATAAGAGPMPSGRIRRALVEPGAGGTVPVVEVRRGFTTVLSWTDTTGSPWPVEEVLVDSQFLPGDGQQSGAEGHLVYLAPKRRYLTGNLVVKLQDLAEPVVVMLRDGGGAESDFRVEMRLPRPGPGVDAAALMRPASFHAGDGELRTCLPGNCLWVRSGSSSKAEVGVTAPGVRVRTCCCCRAMWCCRRAPGRRSGAREAAGPTGCHGRP